MEERPVVVCTKYRGVFFGYATETSGSVIQLSRCRMCVYWEKSLKGVLGLASQGPTENSSVSGAANSIELRGITAVLEVTPEAVERWEAGPWKK